MAEGDIDPETGRTETAPLPDAAGPEIEVKRKRTISLVWLIPLVAALIGAWLVVTSLADKGPVVTVTFLTANSLEAGKTRVRLKDVEVGLVKSVEFEPGLAHVIVTLALEKEMTPHVTEGTRFWVVRPRVGFGGVSGLNTLLSGAYVAMAPGPAGNPPQRHFVGLEEPPRIPIDTPGRSFVLHTKQLGGIGIGSMITFRGIRVGEITRFDLSEDAEDVALDVFIRAPYDKRVRTGSRFWNISGIEMSFGADGMEVQTQSLEALLLSSIAFDTVPKVPVGEIAPARHAFHLYPDRDSIDSERYMEKLPFVLYLTHSVRGLKPGAPVEFRGIRVGTVADVRLTLDPKTLDVGIPVLIELEPDRVTLPGEDFGDPIQVMDTMVRRGLRARLQIGNILTGQLFVALDLDENEPVQGLGHDGRHHIIPTLPARLEEIARSVTGLLERIQTLPIEDIGREMAEAVKTLNRTMQEFQALSGILKDAVTDAQRVLKNASGTPKAATAALTEMQRAASSLDRFIAEKSPVRYELLHTMQELSTAARSIRLMADYLQRHPEALLQGKGRP